MAGSARGVSKSRPGLPEPIPTNACWIQSDAYDRAAYRTLREESPSLQVLEEAGGALLPQFAPLLQDLFCLLFKYNVVFREEAEVRPSAALNRILLRALDGSDLGSYLRGMTLLDEVKAGLAVSLLGEGVLAVLRSQKALGGRDLLDLWDLSRQEEVVQEKTDEARAAEELLSREDLSPVARKKVAEGGRRVASEADAAQARLRQKARQQDGDLTRVEKEVETRFRKEAVAVARHLEDAAEQAEGWSLLLGGGGERSSVGLQLELGRRLAGNEKLRKLARMVGRMRRQALALRRKIFERRDEEIFEVGVGADLGRLLPHEMLALRHRVLRKDFSRRFVEGTLALYALRGVEEKGRGPMVVCVDTSSSMIGDKEVWAKAVALTLMDIACRQRRLYRSICFASADTPLRVVDLNPRQRFRPDPQRVMELAECFLGGGTDFEQPLEAAVQCLGTSRFKRGDIVFITDGECQVSAPWAENFRRLKSALGFSLFSILIDVGPATAESLRPLSDRLTTVSKLTDDAAGDLFVAL